LINHDNIKGMAQTDISETTIERSWPWLFAALAAHTAWGAYPVFARYLQTISLLPSMSLLVIGSLISLAGTTLITRPKLKASLFRSRLIWVFIIVIATRAITNLLAARFTLSIYVQLITLMTPFLVVLLSATLLRDEIPRYTGRAIFLALIGALLMMSGDIGEAGMHFSLSTDDWIGIGLALGSSLALALYMILIRRGVRHHIAGESMLLIQLLTIFAVSLPLSLLLGEDWGHWGQLQTADWLVFACFSLGVLLGANLGQVSALRQLGAPMVSSLLAWRLVSALIFGALLLDERLTSLWQLLGALIVLLTISWYLWQQRTPKPEVSGH
jgi:drug/metabolite transporter (DMT)-like permease